MNYSSVVITTADRPEGMPFAALERIDGLELHQTDPDSRRIVAVIEAETTGLEADIFEKIRLTDGVADVSLVGHYFEDEALEH